MSKSIEEVATKLIEEVQGQLQSAQESTLVYKGAIQGIEELLRRLNEEDGKPSAEEPPAQQGKES